MEIEQKLAYDVGPPGLTLVDLAPGVTVCEARGKTEASFEVHPELRKRAA